MGPLLVTLLRIFEHDFLTWKDGDFPQHFFLTNYRHYIQTRLKINRRHFVDLCKKENVEVEAQKLGGKKITTIMEMEGIKEQFE